jgi:hypothetical protein
MDPTNLIEYHLCIDNSDNDITQLIQNVRSKFGKSITSEFTRFVHCDMFYEHTAMAHKKTVKTYTKQCVSVEDDGKIKKMNFTKTRIPYHMFPCTHHLHEITYITKVAFCIHHNVYMNFDMCLMEGETVPFHQVYINVNLDNKVDKTIIDNALESIMKVVDATF